MQRSRGALWIATAAAVLAYCGAAARAASAAPEIAGHARRDLRFAGPPAAGPRAAGLGTQDPPSAVGLEAVGVAPRVALRYAASLDVRDAFNRPVSARLIERQIKDAQAEAAARAEVATRLPGLRAVAKLLEALVWSPLALLPAPAGTSGPEASALPRALRSAARWVPLPRASRAAAAPHDPPVFSSVAALIHSASSRRDVLRC